MFVDIALRQVAHNLGDLIDVTGGDLLDVELIAPGPVHFLLHDGGAQNLEHLRHRCRVHDIADTHLLRVLHRNIDDQTVRGQD